MNLNNTTDMSSQQLVIDQDPEALSLSRRLVRSLSQRLKRKNSSKTVSSDEDVVSTGLSLRCLTLNGRGGGCKVGADTGEEFGDSSIRRRSNGSEEGDGYYAAATICQNDVATVNCFSYGIKKFWKRHQNRRLLTYRETQKCSANVHVHTHLPDDILEMCLVRLPLTSLMNARLVCRKWRGLTMTPRFLQMRRDSSFQTPWLFLFGIVKDGCCSGEVHALDVSQNQWHRIAPESEALKGRFLFSVASFQDDVYIVGGCSSLANFGRVDQTAFKTHKGVLVFNAVSKSFRRAASMNCARSSPVLGIVEHSPDCLIVANQQNRANKHFDWSRVGGTSDVYQDPHSHSIRRPSRRSADERDSSVHPNFKPYKFTRQKYDGSKRFMIIAVGGRGSWDEPLDSGEVYDPVSNKWTEIQRLPLDFGVARSGVMCNGMFYVYSDYDRLAGYDVKKGCWVKLQTTSPCPPRVHEYHPTLVSSKGRLLMLCVSWCEGDGQIGRRNKAVRKMWELDVVNLTWKEVSVHPDAPMDWNAAFRADEDEGLIFGVEMFKIFGQVLDFVSMFDGTRWRHISRNHVGRDTDAASCATKAIAVLRL